MQSFVVQGNAQDLSMLEDSSVQLVVTSPPYFGLRSYGGDDHEIGIEDSIAGYLKALMLAMAELWRVTTPDGNVFVNLGDRTSGPQRNRNFIDTPERARSASAMATPGDHRVEGRKGSLALIPARFALACLDAHWIVRSEIVWSKVRFIPDHSTMRRPQRSHETIYQLTRRTDTFVAEVDDPGRSVWTIAPEPLMVPEWADHHAAAMPTEMARRIIERWSAPGDLVLDPFAGAGTTGLVASVLGRKYALIDLNPRYVELAEWRIGDATERKKVRKRHARIVTEKGISVIPRCGVCGVDISHRRLGSRTCSDACRAKAYRDR